MPSKHTPDPDALWQAFASTGRVSDYLRYRRQANTAGEEEGHGRVFHDPGSHHPGKQQHR